MVRKTVPSTSIGRRILQFPITRMIVAIALVIIPQVVVQAILRSLRSALSLSDSLPLDLLTYGLYVLVVYFAYRLYVWIIEQREATELSLEGAGWELGAGALMGVGLFAVTIGILWLLDVYHVTGVNRWSVVFPALGLAVSSGFTEEVLFRGIVFRIPEEGLGTWISLVISAGVFGFLHLLNPNATLTSGVAVALEAGLLLGAAFVLTRRLWLATGIHIAVNLAQGGIFGVAVSGNQMQGLLQATLDGPAWLSGGGFGAEGSAVTVVMCLVAFAALILAAGKRGQIRKPPWARKRREVQPAVS